MQWLKYVYFWRVPTRPTTRNRIGIIYEVSNSSSGEEERGPWEQGLHKKRSERKNYGGHREHVRERFENGKRLYEVFFSAILFEG